MRGNPKPDNPEQFKRFLETAKELGAGNRDDATFDRVLEKVARSDSPKPTPKARRPRKPQEIRKEPEKPK